MMLQYHITRICFNLTEVFVMKKSLISLAVLSVVFPLSSHAAQISGQLTDNSGQPIAGVAVHVHGKEKTVTTNNAGQYQIELDADSQLHFSKDGFLDKRISVKNEAKTINFVLEKSSIEAITVYASALHKSNLDMTSPVTVLSGEELKDKSSNTLGETLNKLPGVSQTYFGPVSSSPVIRGLDGPRVRVMQNGLESSDASRVGPDHANTNETLSAEQIEVLRGPATLLYGSGAIGGVVNVVDGRIPTTNYESLEGAVEYKHDTVNEGNTTAFVLNGGDNGFNFHLDGLKRKTEDTEVPKFEAHHEEHEEEHEGEDHADEHDEEVLNSVENSFIDTTAFNLGTSYVNEHLVVGVSYGKLESDYGIPGHSHAHHDHDHGHEHEEENHGHEDEHEEHGDVFARLTQDRYQARFTYSLHDSMIERFDVKLGYTDYRHAEIEEGMEGTVFTNESKELRATAEHNLLGWHGVVGYHYYDSDYGADGAEAFTPHSDTTQHALFVLEEKTFGDFRVELGGRFENTEIDAPEIHLGHDEHDHEAHDEEEHHGEEYAYVGEFDSVSLSAGTIWNFQEGHSVALSLGHSERAPSAAELLSNGLHIATSTYDLGLGYEIEDGEIHFEPENVESETSNNIDLTLRKFNGDFGYTINAFYNQIDNFYFQQDTGLVIDAHHDEMLSMDEYLSHGHDEDEATRVFQYQYADVDLYGIEFDVHYQVNEQLLVKLIGDHIRNDVKDSSEYLPRFPQNKLGFEAEYDWHALQVNFAATHYFEQDKLGAHETHTDSYTLFDVSAKYNLDVLNTDSFVFAKVQNITDELAFSHTSFIKDIAPLPGRNVQLGLRVYF